jgi:phage-related protein
MRPAQIVFYETASGRRPVANFLDGLANRPRAKVLDVLTMLEEAGQRLGPPWLKKIDADLWEVRVQADRVRVRILFCQAGGELVLLHALKKKADRLPARDVATARHRRLEHRTPQGK